MIHRFVTEEVKASETKIELTREPKHYKTVIKYPPPNPRDRVDDEYEDQDD